MARVARSPRATTWNSHRNHAYTLLELVIVLSVIGLLAGLSWPVLMRPWSKSQVQQAAQDLSRELMRTRLNAIEKGQTFRLRWRPGTGEFEIRRWRPPSPEVTLLGDESELGAFPDTRSRSTMPSSEPTTAESATAQMAPERGADNGADEFAADDSTSSTASPFWELPNGVVFLDPTQSTELLETSPLREPTTARETVSDDPSLDFLPAEASARDDSLADSRSTVPWSTPIWFYPDGRTSNARWTLTSEDGYQIDVTLRGWVGSVRVGPVQLQTTPETELGGPVPAPTGAGARRSAIDL